MRNTLILLLALVAGTAFAQAPVIDFMLIDEWGGTLSVYGDFGTTQGKVWCDSVELPVLSWSDTLVTATIPLEDRGSSGPVNIENNSTWSNTRNITAWKLSIVDGWQNLFSNGQDEGRVTEYYLYLRYDFHSVLVNKTPSFFTIYASKKSVFINQTWSPTSSNYYVDSQYYQRGYVDMTLRKLTLAADFIIDSMFGLHGGYVDRSMGSINSSTSWYSSEPIFIPPPKAIALQNNPSLIAPKNEQSNLGTDDILLQWDTLKYMDAYHIQLSKDSLVNGQRTRQAQQGFSYIVDTIVSSLDFTLPPLEKNTKYYWRVCGVNTEGESRWSEVWSFTTGTSTDVKAETVRKELRIYPNPATSELTILTPEPTRLLLYDVTGKIIKSEQTTSNETKWDVSLLPNGTYILGTSGGQMQVVQIVK